MRSKPSSKIMLISRSWSSYERSGVTLVAELHLTALLESGYEICIVGADERVVNMPFNIKKIHVNAAGSGAFYNKSKFDSAAAFQSVDSFGPDLIIIEGWQTALTDGFVDVGYARAIPVVMISHGISVLPFTKSPTEIIRSFGWLLYKWVTLPRLIRKLDKLTVLDHRSISNRFYDRDLALRLGLSPRLLVNAPFNICDDIKSREDRADQILCVGYYSRINKQLSIIKKINKVDKGLNFVFVGKKEGAYYEQCRKKAQQLGVSNRCVFLEDHECNLSELLGNSIAVVSLSITEVLPLTLLEAMASGTPFISTDVGAVSTLESGLLTGAPNVVEKIHTLYNDNKLWNTLSMGGLVKYRKSYTVEIVKKQLSETITG